jgi:ribosomal-protein-alanine N-acetyltransferase
MHELRKNVLDSAAQGLLLARDMVDKDLNQIVLIEQNAQASPWARLSFEECLSRCESSSEHACRVLHVGDGIVAYHVVSSVLDELHILNVVAVPHLQGIGLGHRLMQDIVEFAESRSLSSLFLEVRASNSVAQNLYEKWGFEQIAIRKQYYRNPNVNGPKEDALVFVKRI